MSIKARFRCRLAAVSLLKWRSWSYGQTSLQRSPLHLRIIMPLLLQCMSHHPRRKLWPLACFEGCQRDRWMLSCNQFPWCVIATVRESHFRRYMACVGCRHWGRLRICDRSRMLLSSWSFCCGKDRIFCLFGIAEEGKLKTNMFYQDWWCLRLPRNPWFLCHWGIW